MSNPNYIHTITVYHREEDGSYTRTVLRGCFWKSEIVITQNGTQAGKSNTYTVRIPLESTDKKFCVSAGDIIIHGECEDVISDQKGGRPAEVLNRYKPEAFKVTAFSDNTSFPVDRHYRLGG